MHAFGTRHTSHPRKAHTQGSARKFGSVSKCAVCAMHKRMFSDALRVPQCARGHLKAARDPILPALARLLAAAQPDNLSSLIISMRCSAAAARHEAHSTTLRQAAALPLTASGHAAKILPTHAKMARLTLKRDRTPHHATRKHASPHHRRCLPSPPPPFARCATALRSRGSGCRSAWTRRRWSA